jgi:hypothetical protein
MTKLEYQLLITLSHLEPMGLDKIFIDLDRKFVVENPEITLEDITRTLEELTAKKHILCLEVQGQKNWIKPMPKNRLNLWQRLLKLIKLGK